MRNILILKGSPRERGNSAVLAEKAAEGALAAGAQVESIYLHGLDIRPCDACDLCLEQGECVIEDDMRPLYPKLAAADAILLASPIYWFTFSAQLKALHRPLVRLPGQQMEGALRKTLRHHPDLWRYRPV